MDRLTREEIERKRDFLNAAIALLEGMSQQWMDERWRASNDLCDLALQSLSQEAVRDEVLEEAARVCELFAPKIVETNSASELIASTAHQIREKILALKREPNAAESGEIAHAMSMTDDGPAPAAPDVASMVKRLNDISEGREGRIAHIFKDCREAAALLAKLGQGWIPVSERLPEGDGQVLVTYNTGGADVLTRQAVRNLYEAAEIEGDGECFITHWMPLPPAPGASDD